MPGASGQISGKVATGVLSMLTVVLLSPAAALGSSGEITRALANAEWTVGDIASTVSWNGCAGDAESSSCGWAPYMTIGPGASLSECDSPGRDWPGLGEGVALVFGAGGFKGPNTFSHESPMVALRGGPEQLACLFANERTPATGARRPLRLDAALLTAPPPPAAETEGPTTGEGPAAIDEPPDEAPAESTPAEDGPLEAQEPPAEDEPALEEEQGEEAPVEAESPSEQELPISPGQPEEPVRPLVEEPPSFIEDPPEPPSGEITRAFASADWTRGNIAGSFTWDGCARTIGAPTSYCAWIPYATIGPGALRLGCASPERNWSSLGGNVSLVSWGGENVGPGTHEFDFPGIWLGDGSDRLLCLAVVEITPGGTYTHPLDAALLTAPPMVSDAKVVAEN